MPPKMGGIFFTNYIRSYSIMGSTSQFIGTSSIGTEGSQSAYFSQGQMRTNHYLCTRKLGY